MNEQPQSGSERPEEEDLTPRQIVAELDRYIISQDQAKKAVAIALRNRWRRLRVEDDLRDEITPKNILMIGPTGVGKTEISRRLARLANAPFVKVEASKFTEVGYVGRDVETIIRDLVEISIHMTREEARERVRTEADAAAEERLLDLLLPGSAEGDEESDTEHGAAARPAPTPNVFFQDPAGVAHTEIEDETESSPTTREKLRRLLRAGQLEDRVVEFETVRQVHTQMQIVGPQGFGEIEGQIKDMFAQMLPRQRELKQLPIRDARRYILEEIQESLLDQESLVEAALVRAQERGIVFIDEVDKICGNDGGGRGPDVSREGVQRDLLPLVEGSTVATKYGQVQTDHILFIASGAFHHSKPSDLMPEFQGRFPIRVELSSLTADHFYRILSEPQNALLKQYRALMATEGVELEFTDEAVRTIAELTAEVNTTTENIGARRLHTLLERVLEEVSFTADGRSGEVVVIDQTAVRASLGSLVTDRELARFIL